MHRCTTLYRMALRRLPPWVKPWRFNISIWSANQNVLAADYVASSGYSVNEISYLLGFSEPGNFSRAFKRWHSVPPSQYRIKRNAGACPRIGNLLRKSWIWPDFPIIFVKYAQYSPQMIEKSKSNQLSLATAPILGQAP
ncbi:MAG: helix-turn-helix transcriptional regulator, partial [Gammaproteobacteria bacterium]|nr:helix-turn-helix transcriptional regulator [Gammaproteobacteria bacterium]